MNTRFSSGSELGLAGGGRQPAASARRPDQSGLFFLVGLLLWSIQLVCVSAAPSEEAAEELELRAGGIVRGPRSVKRLALVFTGHSFAEGGEVILNELARHQAKGSFFFTGDFLANTNFRPLLERLVRSGHYLGPHSDKHLLYCSWDSPQSNLVSCAEFCS
ncbi:MAG TPA: polysaccharide deacetylase family protein, partial [Bacillota bacterium]|nr:polysaccharide deacetylase family protein [Bacillota bacterium]